MRLVLNYKKCIQFCRRAYINLRAPTVLCLTYVALELSTHLGLCPVHACWSPQATHLYAWDVYFYFTAQWCRNVINQSMCVKFVVIKHLRHGDYTVTRYKYILVSNLSYVALRHCPFIVYCEYRIIYVFAWISVWEDTIISCEKHVNYPLTYFWGSINSPF